MKRHATLRDTEDVKWVAKQLLPAVHQAVAQPAADNNTQHAVEDQVVDLRRFDDRPGCVRAFPRKPPCQHETDDVHQAVPAHMKRRYLPEGADGKNDRVDPRVSEHAR